MAHNCPSWMYGDFDPIQIEINLLQSKLSEAKRSGDRIQSALISENLRAFEQLRATG